ncbi:beta-ketoacyl-ACP synthase II [Clostridium pasteurianum]|uniref:3-oxoacyl-[acyl-carrier-protein] synthase 2 n=1 Tax=Clostridium pasteurianum BC1 TaxID=86416 RepID=R4K5P3_CLOPA|nr:beta-ketoacyl-ACP synthase II [Clostridium pasteurianum]AGK96996.1 beta-ketoacyl-acyl-carrier-protein synthase II [Clostridium pasteurianum BC1]
MMKRVVITGMGIISPLGLDIRKFWSSIKEGKSSIDYVSSIDVTDMPTKVAAEIKNFDPLDFMHRKEIRKASRFMQFAIAASQMAIEDSKLDVEKVDKYEMGVIVGSGIGGMEVIEKQYDTLCKRGPSRIAPFSIPMIIPNMASSEIAIRYGAKGYNECVISACATGTNAIGNAFKIIRDEEAKVMITGGSEAVITPLVFSGFCAMRAMSKSNNPNNASRPFDAERDGFVMGEGAGILVLEELEHALRRGANILGEIVGYGCTNDAYDIVAPNPEGEGAARCMLKAIENSKISTEDIGYINAHGTSTVYNDKMETLAIKRTFGEQAKSIPISSTKSMTGHLLGASGAIEAIITTLALKDGFLPPTINYNTKDPECDLDYVPNIGRSTDINFALSNSFGFGGHNSTLVFKKY